MHNNHIEYYQNETKKQLVDFNSLNRLFMSCLGFAKNFLDQNRGNIPFKECTVSPKRSWDLQMQLRHLTTY